jgi:hypothetical protein
VLSGCLSRQMCEPSTRIIAESPGNVEPQPLLALLDQIRLMAPGLLTGFPKISALLDRFEALPAIAAYQASSRFLRRPINNTSVSAKVGWASCVSDAARSVHFPSVVAHREPIQFCH